MDNYCCRIERLKNGYEIEMKDPEIVKANQKPRKGSEPYTYRDPYVSYAFTKIEDVLTFLKKNLDKALPDDEYDTSFDAAVASDDDE